MKLIKKILIAIGILVGVIVILGGFYLYKNKAEISKFHPNETKEVVAGIYSIKNNYVNMYLVKNGDSYIAIDAAIEQQNVKQEMDKLKIAPEAVTAVLLTHTDYDHVGAIKLFKNAKVYISTAEQQMINGETVRDMIIKKNKLDSAYEMIEDNQTIDISGLKVKGILTPGHTPGSMSYIINDEYLFSGDTLSLKDGKADIFSELFNMDSDTQAKSITKLANLSGIKDVFTAHYGYTDKVQDAFGSWKEK